MRPRHWRELLVICVICFAYATVCRAQTTSLDPKTSAELKKIAKQEEARKKIESTQHVTRTDPALHSDITDNRLNEQQNAVMKELPKVTEMKGWLAKDAQKGLGKYGNWYGPDWCGGQRPSEHNGQMGNMQPIDSLDEACKQHDLDYASAESASDGRARRQIIKQADLDLLQKLNALGDDSRKWPNPPKEVDMAKAYRNRAIEVFKNKVILVD